MSSNTDALTSSEHLIGRVKWFNNKAGYGFITVTDGSRSGSDIFVHHSTVNVENQQYKYLIQGEYVEFDLVKTESKTHEWQAANVVGIKGGKLMCETRRELKFARNEYKTTKQPEETQQMPRQRAPRARGEGPRETTGQREATGKREETRPRETAGKRESTGPRETAGEKKEWTLVSNNAPAKSRGRPRKSAEAK
jgi:cold shock CspA family protein